MQSKIIIELYGNGNLKRVETTGDKIYANGVSATEYYLYINSLTSLDYQWRNTDHVYINLTKPIAPFEPVSLKMEPTTIKLENGSFINGWVYLSNGYETSLEVPQDSLPLIISFLARRFSLVNGTTLVMEKPTQEHVEPIYPSGRFNPRKIDNYPLTDIETRLDDLTLNKMDKVPTATNGYLASFDNAGQVVDSGVSATIDTIPTDSSRLITSGAIFNNTVAKKTTLSVSNILSLVSNHLGYNTLDNVEYSVGHIGGASDVPSEIAGVNGFSIIKVVRNIGALNAELIVELTFSNRATGEISKYLRFVNQSWQWATDWIKLASKTYIDELISNISTIELKKVDILPTVGESKVIYLVPSGEEYEEYIWLAADSKYELIGTTKVDLSDYYTKSETDLKLTQAIQTAIYDSWQGVY